MRSRPFSAGEVEKYSYCPLSWWLSGPEEEMTEEFSEGNAAHSRLNTQLSELSGRQREAGIYSRMIMYYAITATVLAFIGISVLKFDRKTAISRILLLLAIVWLLMAISILYLSQREFYNTKIMTERVVLFLAILSMVLSILSVTILQVNAFLAMILESASLLWLIGASSFLYLDLWSERKAEMLGSNINVNGKIIYIGDDSHPVLSSSDGSLSGRPDFIVERDGMLMPVEFKSGRVPSGPLFSHIMQISAYCRLVEDNFGSRPDYGLIYYGRKSFTVDFDDEVEKLLNTKLEEMKRSWETGQAHRNHNRPGKCARCSRRARCPERLA
ncbi:MAG: PD-(D/E)XK nuclease family protein [Candidatus Thermoplasmatota archaeon]|nr:PD-(D/E)XK nuclease family protein [Candidatus Thermoplasmatota archaeon]MCL5437220.1 PD-(D/E)XK nuclease family protein [Candidatus Thermoplasmatota archaeon]